MKAKTTFWSDLTKGIFAGLAWLVPGTSAGTMMVSMGFYEKLVRRINHLPKDWKRSWRFLSYIAIGLLSALLILRYPFRYLLETYPIPIRLGFCGLIVGGLPLLGKKVRHKGFAWPQGAAFLVFFFGSILLSFLQGISASPAVLSLNFASILLLACVGLLCGFTIVIPGLSCPLLLSLLGYSQPIRDVLHFALECLFSLRLASLTWCITVLLPLAAGLLIGLFLAIRIAGRLLSRHKILCAWGFLGLLLGSPIAILLSMSWQTFSWVNLIVGIACFILGYYFSDHLARM